MSTLEAFPRANLSPAVLEQLLSLGRLVRYGDGDEIFREGDHALNLYILASGSVAIESRLGGGHAVPVATVAPGEWFSWSALLEPRIERTSARADGPVEVWAIRGGVVTDLALEKPEFGLQIYRALAELLSARLTWAWMQFG